MSSWILISKKIPYLSPWNFSWVKPCLILNDIIFIVSNLYCIILSSFLLQQKFNTCMLYQVSVTASPDSLHNTTRVSFEKNSHFTLSLAQIVQYSSSAWYDFWITESTLFHPPAWSLPSRCAAEELMVCVGCLLCTDAVTLHYYCARLSVKCEFFSNETLVVLCRLSGDAVTDTWYSIQVLNFCCSKNDDKIIQ